MGYDLTIKRGDTRYCIKAVLKNRAGKPVDLTNCIVNFHMVNEKYGFRKARVSRAVHIQDAAAGEVWVVWVPGDTDVAGIYRAEFEAVYQDGRRETFPSNRYISMQIMNDLG